MALEVAEACSGIRSLMSLLTLAIIYGYLTERRLWVRWLLAIASVPIAVAANSRPHYWHGICWCSTGTPKKPKDIFTLPGAGSSS